MSGAGTQGRRVGSKAREAVRQGHTGFRVIERTLDFIVSDQNDMQGFEQRTDMI